MKKLMNKYLLGASLLTLVGCVPKQSTQLLKPQIIKWDSTKLVIKAGPKEVNGSDGIIHFIAGPR